MSIKLACPTTSTSLMIVSILLSRSADNVGNSIRVLGGVQPQEHPDKRPIIRKGESREEEVSLKTPPLSSRREGARRGQERDAWRPEWAMGYNEYVRLGLYSPVVCRRRDPRGLGWRWTRCTFGHGPLGADYVYGTGPLGGGPCRLDGIPFGVETWRGRDVCKYSS